MKTSSSPVLLGVGILLSLTQIQSAYAGITAQKSAQQTQHGFIHQSPEELLSSHVSDRLLHGQQRGKGKMSVDTRAAYLQASAVFYSIFPFIQEGLSEENQKTGYRVTINDLGKEWFDTVSSDNRNKIHLALHSSDGVLKIIVSLPQEDFESSFELVASSNSVDNAFVRKNLEELQKMYGAIFAFIRNANSQEQSQEISQKNLKARLQEQILQSTEREMPLYLKSMEKILQ